MVNNKSVLGLCLFHPLPPKINYKYYSNLNISEKSWTLDSVPVLPLPSYVILIKQATLPESASVPRQLVSFYH